MTANQLRAVFDCNIFVQMLLDPGGSAGACMRLVEAGQITLFVSASVLAEVAEVLNRPRFKRLLPTLTPEHIEAFVEEVADLAVLITNVPEEFHYARDPEDEPYINLALVTEAHYLVSLDNDLLDLMKETSEASRDFQRRYPLLKIITPAVLLTIVKESQK